MTEASDNDLERSGLECPVCEAELYICKEASGFLGEPWLHCLRCHQLGVRSEFDAMRRSLLERLSKPAEAEEPRQMSLIPDDVDDLI